MLDIENREFTPPPPAATRAIEQLSENTYDLLGEGRMTNSTISLCSLDVGVLLDVVWFTPIILRLCE